MMTSTLLDALTDDEVIAETKRLLAAERAATAALLRALMEIDARRLYLREGCPSLFIYCTQVLHLSEHAATCESRQQEPRANGPHSSISSSAVPCT